MTLPVRRASGRLAEQPFPGWMRDPLAEFDDLVNRMGSLLESTLGSAPATPGAPWSPPAAGTPWSPPADFSETDDAYVFEIDLPGVQREDIDIELGDRELIISGEIRQREQTGTVHQTTRRTGRFEYRMPLPGEADGEHIEATLRDGVLTIRIPKARTAQHRRIEIASGE
ncbi:Hsp20/alpha crystallin family protein [Streptomyces sp. NPDC007251]|uniref:Hsp20/alpha crystallin family protein n=1 Tax=unclassified Streptomyces TaxID=2593676 RepID=UPI003410D042